MNLKVISRNVGFALLASAFFMFLSILISMGNGNDSALAALIISFTLTFTVGVFPFIFVRKAPAISLKDGYMIIVLSWTLSFIFGMLPYALWGGPFTAVNALFEAVSGYTTTGATILENVEILPDSLLFWRSSTHFIGGLGVVVFLLLVIPSSSPVRLRLTNMELSSLSREGYRSKTNKTVWIFSSVYIGLNIAAFLCYLLAGMSAFDAVNHAFSVAATGGFSTRTMSIGAFDSAAVNIITMVFMLLSSIHFGIIFILFATRSLRPLKNPLLKGYLYTILAAALTASFLFKSKDLSWGDSLMNGFFSVISTISTTGFAISDNRSWQTAICAITILLSIFCGMSGSTSGGIKLDRIAMLLRSIGQQVRKSIFPSAVSRIHIGGTSLKDEEVYPHLIFIGLYFIFAAVSSVAAVLFGMDTGEAIATSIASLSNVGPSIGEYGTMGCFDGLPVGAKLLFMADMFLGRVEIYPVLAVIMTVFTRRK